MADKRQEQKSPSNGATDKPPGGTANDSFVDVDKLRNAYGIIAVISQHRWDGMLTFAIFREFTKHGKLVRTSFIPENLAKSCQEMLELVIVRMGELRRDPSKLAVPPLGA